MRLSVSRNILRISVLAFAAVLLTLFCETFIFNHRAWITLKCDTREVDLFTLTDSHGNYLSDGEPIRITPSESNLFVVQTEELCEETIALRITLSGTSTPVDVVVELMDEASAYEYTEAYSGTILPGAEGLDSLNCALYSSGLMSALKLTFRLDRTLNADVWLESIELDPVIPVQWQPLRMVLCFSVLFSALFLFFIPWRPVIYQSQKALHKTVLLFPLVLLILFYGFLAPHSMMRWKPEGAHDLLWIWQPDRQADISQSGGYGLLFSALLEGQFSLLEDPSEELLALENPYDPSLRKEADVPYLYDYALYNGQYYMYFGLGPLLLFYFPYYWLTGQLPNFVLVCMLSAILSAAAVFWAVTGVVRRYVRKPNLLLLALACTAAALMAAGPFFVTQPSRYENVVVLNIAMMAGAIGFGYHAVMSTSVWKRITQFILCGVCFAFQAHCRANTLLITTALLAAPFISVLGSGKPLVHKLRDASCFLVPALIGVGLAMAYNYSRFGSVIEFGQSHQLTEEDIHYNVFRIEYIPQALWVFLASFPSISLPFPYIHASSGIVNLTGNTLYQLPTVGILTYPLAWPVLFPSSMRRIENRTLRTECRWSLGLSLLMALVLIVITFCVAGSIQRYTCDMLLIFAIAGSTCGLLLCGDDEHTHTSCSVFILLCALTILAGILFGFSNSAKSIEMNDPLLFCTLKRMFFPY